MATKLERAIRAGLIIVDTGNASRLLVPVHMSKSILRVLSRFYGARPLKEFEMAEMCMRHDVRITNYSGFALAKPLSADGTAKKKRRALCWARRVG